MHKLAALFHIFFHAFSHTFPLNVNERRVANTVNFGRSFLDSTCALDILSSVREMSDYALTPGEVGAQRLWTNLAVRLRKVLDERTFRIWFGAALPGDLTDEQFVITVPDHFTRQWIENHFLGILEAEAHRALSEERRVSLVVRNGNGEHNDVTEAVTRRRADDLNPRYTFDPFVIGTSNRLAYAAALAVAQSSTGAYNPLFIYGRTGLGKTHLLQAIANYIVQRRPEPAVRYVTSETFLNDFINSLRDKRIEGFKQRYRNFDVLLVDDVQFLEHKERIQEEFFHTFNSLHEAGSQIVLSSDRPPHVLSNLDERLRSRFGSGLIADIRPPDLATRIAILHEKSKAETPIDSDVLAFIATCVPGNVRELEGALTRVLAFSSLTERQLSVPLAEEVLRDAFPATGATEVSVERIQEAVCERFGLSAIDLCSAGRSQKIVYPRHVAMYLCRELTETSLLKIGSSFGGRDHTTVSYATSKIENLARNDRGTHDLVQDLISRITR
jgi:chromosomal replication initiator protein